MCIGRLHWNIKRGLRRNLDVGRLTVFTENHFLVCLKKTKKHCVSVGVCFRYTAYWINHLWVSGFSGTSVIPHCEKWSTAQLWCRFSDAYTFNCVNPGTSLYHTGGDVVHLKNTSRVQSQAFRVTNAVLKTSEESISLNIRCLDWRKFQTCMTSIL